MKTHAQGDSHFLGVGLLLALLAGCGEAETRPDQCMRREIFKHCVETTKDAKACESPSYYQSLRPARDIKPECKTS